MWVNRACSGNKRVVSALLLAGSLGACSSVSNPTPVSTYDGLYVGSRRSNDAGACGTDAQAGQTSATISKGKVKINLFSPATKMDGTVGEDGTVRASGLWLAPHSFMAMTVLKGRIAESTLTGIASNSRCITDISLSQQSAPRRGRPAR